MGSRKEKPVLRQRYSSFGKKLRKPTSALFEIRHLDRVTCESVGSKPAINSICWGGSKIRVFRKLKCVGRREQRE